MKAKCGRSQIEYDNRCSYVCECEPDGCNWEVSCPDGHGGHMTTSGTGIIATPPPPKPIVTVSGVLDAIAASLEGMWKRQVTVPPELRGKNIPQRTIEGSPKEVAEALGLKLGA